MNFATMFMEKMGVEASEAVDQVVAKLMVA